jgi:hypothetical protein
VVGVLEVAHDGEDVTEYAGDDADEEGVSVGILEPEKSEERERCARSFTPVFEAEGILLRAAVTPAPSSSWSDALRKEERAEETSPEMLAERPALKRGIREGLPLQLAGLRGEDGLDVSEGGEQDRSEEGILGKGLGELGAELQGVEEGESSMHSGLRGRNVSKRTPGRGELSGTVAELNVGVAKPEAAADSSTSSGMEEGMMSLMTASSGEWPGEKEPSKDRPSAESRDDIMAWSRWYVPVREMVAEAGRATPPRDMP